MKAGRDNATRRAPVAVSHEAAVICAAGKVEAIREVKVASPVTGVLKEVSVEEGQRLRKGDVIAALENSDLAARVAEAEATVQVRRASLDRLVDGSREQERREAAAAADEAKVILDHAHAELARRDGLFKDDLISRSEYDQFVRGFQVAQARFAAASDHFSLVNAPARADDLARAKADVELAEAQLAEARAVLEETIIRAPFDGTVLKRFRRAGEVVSNRADTPIVSFGDNSRLRVRVDVDETDIGKLRLGERAYFTAAAFGNRKFWGRVVSIGRELGRKNIDTDEPGEKVDTEVLETLVDLDGHPPLPDGLRMDSYLLVNDNAPSR